ncbi:hypothetical protein HPB48_006707 [Haemaphysalis longicornis]|uniref:tRNA-uridine aminocarboxypropyltransferase n=1 Tax=Haemaphysalis longicornis TaxID=44386 RepID=A0A9J6G600_HAELO|nr:hypothetical protein HPB48_006707 [Haemaphysalis longicornis]
MRQLSPIRRHRLSGVSPLAERFRPQLGSHRQRKQAEEEEAVSRARLRSYLKAEERAPPRNGHTSARLGQLRRSRDPTGLHSGRAHLFLRFRRAGKRFRSPVFASPPPAAGFFLCAAGSPFLRGEIRLRFSENTAGQPPKIDTHARTGRQERRQKKNTRARRRPRPPSVCWCCSLPANPVPISSKVYILQHPGEVKRNLSTAPMLEAALSSEQCLILRGRRFSRERCGALESILGEAAPSGDTILLYPGPEAKDVRELATVQQRGRGYNIVVLDGTWSQARSLFFNSPQLHSLPQTLCRHQLEHGAVTHQSKEFLIRHGLYMKPLSRRIIHKLARNEDLKDALK